MFSKNINKIYGGNTDNVMQEVQSKIESLHRDKLQEEKSAIESHRDKLQDLINDHQLAYNDDTSQIIKQVANQILLVFCVKKYNFLFKNCILEPRILSNSG